MAFYCYKRWIDNIELTKNEAFITVIEQNSTIKLYCNGINDIFKHFAII